MYNRGKFTNGIYTRDSCPATQSCDSPFKYPRHISACGKFASCVPDLGERPAWFLPVGPRDKEKQTETKHLHRVKKA
jgi:hypothetical protein